MARRSTRHSHSWLAAALRLVGGGPLPSGKAELPPAADAGLTDWCRRHPALLGRERLRSAVVVLWNGRMRSSAGRAKWPDMRIELNPRLRDFPPDETWRTLKHELAHLLAYERHGPRIAPHGIEWRGACAELGIPDEPRCHQLALPRRKLARPHAYECPQCRQVLHRARKMKSAAACLACCRRHSGGRYDPRFRLRARPVGAPGHSD